MTQSAGTVLVIARDAAARSALARTLGDAHYVVLEAADRLEAITCAEGVTVSAIVVDVQATASFVALPGRDHVPAIVLATAPNEAALRALRARSTEVLVKPVPARSLVDAVERVIAGGIGITARSPSIRRVLAEVARLQNADCSVLVLGETGTGKTVLARRIHEIGARGEGPFVDLNCAGLTPDLVESELFGHERGAFTGANIAKQGLFDVAHGGTLFLDEIGDIDLRVQPRVLKVLEEKRFRRMGDVRERTVDVRLIAATHQDLRISVAQQRFRADLYYRIATVRLVMPSLRERPEDIVPLACAMLDGMAHPDVLMSRDAEERLCAHRWPGNIRELKNVIQSSTLLRRGEMLTADDLRFDQSAPVPAVTAAAEERRSIESALSAENGRVQAAAKRLGIPRTTLYSKLRRLGLLGEVRPAYPSRRPRGRSAPSPDSHASGRA